MEGFVLRPSLTSLVHRRIAPGSGSRKPYQQICLQPSAGKRRAIPASPLVAFGARPGTLKKVTLRLTHVTGSGFDLTVDPVIPGVAEMVSDEALEGRTRLLGIGT